MPALYLIQNQTDPKLLPRPEAPGSEQWTSGFWNLSEATVRSLIGGRVYFLKAQAKPSFFGGELLDYRVAKEPPYAGRIILIFRPDPSIGGFARRRQPCRAGNRQQAVLRQEEGRDHPPHRLLPPDS
jgi:hypothetical protein